MPVEAVFLYHIAFLIKLFHHVHIQHFDSVILYLNQIFRHKISKIKRQKIWGTVLENSHIMTPFHLPITLSKTTILLT